MKLLTVGDSFTYGDELADLTKAWPHLLGKELGYSVTNLGQSGGGNTQMIRKVVEHYQDYDLIIIAWSHYARIEHADEYGIYDTWPGSRSAQLFANNINHRNELAEYITKHHYDDYLYKQYLINTLLLQNFLVNQNKQYLMMDAFGNNYFDFVTNKEISSLRDQIDTTYYVGWPDQTMMEITYGCTQGPGGHFLEAGHQRVAEKINEHIRNLGWVS